jgi:FkbM family methyltransferase
MSQDALVYDVGANKGQDTELYLKKGFSVVAIEANPDLCDTLSARFSEQLRIKQLKIVNVAITNTSGTTDFYIDGKNPSWSTTKLTWVAQNELIGGRVSKKLKVKSALLSDIMQIHGVPRYCKIDIEGTDLDALKSLEGVSEVPKFISIESSKTSWTELLEEFLILNKLGYHRYKIVDQTLVNLQRCPNPSLEGAYCDHIFEIGSSGLFGDELPGRWLDQFEALETYKGIFRGYALNSQHGLYEIFHKLGRLQVMIARSKGFRGYINPAYILPPASWYDTHAAL